MHTRTFSALTALFLTAGCSVFEPAHHVKDETPTYDSAVSARVRILSGNGTGDARFWPDLACYTDIIGKDPQRVSVNDGGFVSEWKNSSTSIRIGMPTSPRKYMRVEGLIHKDFIKEYVVNGGKPMTVRLATFPGNWSCRPPAVTFTPVAGNDYDVYMHEEGKRCWVAVRRIDDKGADEPIRPSLAEECKVPATTVQSPPSPERFNN